LGQKIGHRIKQWGNGGQWCPSGQATTLSTARGGKDKREREREKERRGEERKREKEKEREN